MWKPLAFQGEKSRWHFLVFSQRHDITVLHLEENVFFNIEIILNILPFYWHCQQLQSDRVWTGTQRRHRRQRPGNHRSISLIFSLLENAFPFQQFSQAQISNLIIVLRPKAQYKNLLLWILRDLLYVIPASFWRNSSNQAHTAVQVIPQIVRGSRHLDMVFQKTKEPVGAAPGRNGL